VVFFDDDTVPDADVLTLLDTALHDADGVGAHFVTLRRDSLIADYTHADGLIDHRVVHGEVRWLITGAAAFRRYALEAVGGFDLNFLAAGEDVDLSIRLLKAGYKLKVEPRAVVRHDHRARFGQLLETCFRYGVFSPKLASLHPMYRGERWSEAFRRVNPIELARAYREFRGEATRRRSLAFLALHELVVIPYALGLIRSRLDKAPLAAPSWRREAPATAAAASRERIPEASLAGVRRGALAPAAEAEASAV